MALLDLARLPPEGSGGRFVSAGSGAWSDPATWEGGRVPNRADAFVEIAAGHHVTYDVAAGPRLAMVRVDGTLDIATTSDTRLVVDTIGVAPSGTLLVGTPGDPVRPDVTAEIVFADSRFIDRVDRVAGDLDNDPGQLGLGLVSQGIVSIEGAAKTDHLKVATDPMRGDTTLSLAAAPQGWQVGDRILLTATRYTGPAPDDVDPSPDGFRPADPLDPDAWQTQDEIFTIVAVDGATVTLDRALAYDHDTPAAEFKASVANLTRNVVLRSAEPDVIEARGHVMFMHNPEVTVRNAAFLDLGRTDKSRDLDDYTLTSDAAPTQNDMRIAPVDPADITNARGRYSLHLHQTGTQLEGTTAIIEGNVVSGSPGWGFVQHGSAAVLLDNVAYAVYGSAFVAETGDETGAWVHNLAVKSVGRIDENQILGDGAKPSEIIDVGVEKDQARNQDVGVTGTGFWLQGRHLGLIDNVAASTGGAGFFYMHRGVDNVDPLTDTVPRGEIGFWAPRVSINDVPIDLFTGNEAFASGQGLVIVGDDAPRLFNDTRSHLVEFAAWEFGVFGIHIQYSAHYLIENATLYGSTAYAESVTEGIRIGVSTEDVIVKGGTFRDVPIAVFTRDNFTGDTKLTFGLTQAQVDLIRDYGHRLIDLDLGESVRLHFGRRSARDGSFEALDYAMIQSGDLTPLPLTLILDDTSLVARWTPDAQGFRGAEITGVKTDSMGETPFPAFSERIRVAEEDVASVATEFGYFTAADGQRVILVDTVYTDRLTIETRILTHTITLADDWVLPAEARYLGALPDVTLAAYQDLVQIGRSPILRIPGTNEVHYAAGLRDAALANTTFVRGTGLADGFAGDAAPDLVMGWGGADTLAGGGGRDTLIGSLGDDILHGEEGDDRLAGDNGDDAIAGGIGHDWLSGDGGMDRLTGDDGNDLIEGGNGNDHAEGGIGQDTILGDGGADWLDGGDGADSLAGGVGDDTVSGGGGNDVLDGGEGPRDLLSLADAPRGATVLLAAGSALGFGDDSITGFEAVLGSAYADSLAGDGSSNTLLGGAGDDTLAGGSGSDSLDGGEGFDLVSFEDAAGRVSVNLGLTGLQGVRGGLGSVTLVAIEGLIGSAYGDTLAGDGSANLLAGGPGDDWLVGGAGDTLDGGLGFDTADLAGAAAALDVVLGAGGNGTAGSGILLRGIEGVIGTGQADRMLAGPTAVELVGGPGNDTITSGAGNDTLDGGSGINLLSYANAAAGVTVDLGGRRDQETGDGRDRITGFERLLGSAQDDWLAGGAANATLSGGEGADTLIGGLGNDLLEGGLGDDRLILEVGRDTLDGGAGFDVLAFAQGSPGLAVSLALQGTLQQTGGAGVVLLTGIEALAGGTGDDTLTGDAAANALDGGLGNDRLDGAGGADSLAGGAGDDSLAGGEGANSLDGGAGADRLEGGAGDDSLSGGGAPPGAADTLLGGLGWDLADFAAAASGVAVSLALQGTLQQTGGAGVVLLTGIEALAGGTGDDTLTGDAAANALDGGSGTDSLDGDRGADTLFGGAGADTLRGGDGNDVIEGGTAPDVLWGGAGADLFVFRRGDGNDRIEDFGVGDRLQLLGFGAAYGSAAAILALGIERSTGGGVETLLRIPNGDGTSTAITLVGVTLAELSGPDVFLFG